MAMNRLTLSRSVKCGLAWLIISTKGSRTVLRTVGYEGPIAMCWEDVELVLDPVGDRPLSVQDLRGKFTLRFTKSRK